jgi:hypothetical protein
MLKGNRASITAAAGAAAVPKNENLMMRLLIFQNFLEPKALATRPNGVQAQNTAIATAAETAAGGQRMRKHTGEGAAVGTDG